MTGQRLRTYLKRDNGCSKLSEEMKNKRSHHVLELLVISFLGLLSIFIFIKLVIL